MAVAPDGDYIALFTADGILRVFSTDFQVANSNCSNIRMMLMTIFHYKKNIVEVDTGDKRTPYQLLWYVSEASPAIHV